MSGEKIVDVYGIYDIESPGQIGYRIRSMGRAVSWTDSHDNFWLFGGSGYAQSGEIGYLNDLWKFDYLLSAY